MNPQRSHRAAGYVWAVACVVAATLLRFAVNPLLGDTAQYITYFVAIVLTGAMAGRGPALAVTILSTLSVTYFFIGPEWGFLPISLGHAISLGMFAAAAIFISWISGRMHAAQHKARSEADRATGILGSMGDGYLAIDRDWTITAINGAARQMLHRHCPQMVGRSIWDCFPEAVGSRFQADYERVLRENTAARFEEYFPPLGTWFDVSAYPTAEGLALFFRDITQRRQAEAQNRRNEARLESLLKISQHQAQSTQELLDAALEEAITLTDSKVGYIYHYNDTTKEFTLNTWSKDVMQQCAITEQQTVYHLEKTGIWGEAVRQAKPIIVNDFHAPHPLKKGYPDGHAPLHRFMTIPVFLDNHIVGVVGVANKEADYDNADVRQLTLLMDSVWRIADRKRAEQALHEQREWLRVTLSSIGDAVLATDTAGRITFLNPVAGGLTGWTPEEAVGQPSSRVFPIINEQTRQAAEDIVGRVLRDRQVIALANHTALLSRDGREVPIEDSAAPIIDAAGNLAGAVLVFHDVTARRRAQEALRESEATLRGILDATKESIWLFDSDGTIRMGNATAIQRMGRPVEQILGRHFSELMPADLAATRMTQLRKVVESGQPVQFEDRRIGIDFHHSFFPVCDDQGRVTRVTCFSQDITERKRTHEALRQAKEELEQRVIERTAELQEAHRSLMEQSEYLEAFFQHSLTPLVFLDPQFNFLRVNEAYGKVCGRPVSDFSGHNHFEFYPHAENQAIFQEVVRSCKPHVAVARPFEFPDHPEWGVTYWDWTLAPMLDESGEVRFLVFSLQDVTARKRAEMALEERAGQLRALASQLIRAEQRERQRIAQILHEHLQQLLAGAKFDISLLQGQLCGRDACKAPPILERVQKILDQSIADARSLSVELSPPILHAGCLADALHWLGHWMREKHGLQVDVQAERATNPPSEDVRILLFHAVRELLFNVIKHAKARRAAVSMAADQPDRVQVTVSDDGMGFEPEHLHLKAGSASGFGLFSLRERLASLGGGLQIDSRPGAGTRITLEVIAPAWPTTDVDLQGAPASQERPVAPASIEAAAANGGIRVLLADDHAVVRDGLTRILQLQPGLRVIGQASDGQQAIELARQLQPDVILMDVSMPGIDGVEATRQILAHLPHVRVIGLSMHHDEAVAASMAEAGAVNYLPKTTRPDSLVAAIRVAAGSTHT